MKHKEQEIPKYFRLEHLQDEFDFMSGEEIKKNKRFQLLQLRNSGQLDIFLRQVPLCDNEIPDLIFQVLGFFSNMFYYLMLFFCFKYMLIYFLN